MTAEAQPLWIWLADLVLALHLGFILFVVVGQVLIMLGWARGWSWPRHWWFRLWHLLAIGLVMLEAWFGLVCPLTGLETYFRDAAGIATYENGFIRHWVQRLVFWRAPAWVFTLVYTVFAGLVLLTWFAYPPRRKL